MVSDKQLKQWTKIAADAYRRKMTPQARWLVGDGVKDALVAEEVMRLMVSQDDELAGQLTIDSFVAVYRSVLKDVGLID